MANNYSGTTTVTSGGTLTAVMAAALPNSTPGAVVVAGSSALVVQAGNGTTGWSGSQITTLVGNTTWSNSTAVLGIDTTNAPGGVFTYGSNITQGLALAKLGVNTLSLTGANTYTGGTGVHAGLLQLGSNTALGAASGALAVNGGTLDLNGSSPTVGNVTFVSGAIIDSSGTAALTGTPTTCRAARSPPPWPARPR